MFLISALKSIFKPQSSALSADAEIIEKAREQANAIIAEAQRQALQISSQATLGKEGFEKEINQTLSLTFNTAMREYHQFLTSLKESSTKSEGELQTQLKTRVSEILLNLEQNLTSFLTSSQQQSLEAINLELKSARNLIDNYKQQQLAIIDENIVAVLERTLSLVMRSKLTLSDQLDLVYEALEKAKVEKFFS